MTRSTYGGSAADYVARTVEIRPGTTVLALAPGVPLDVRRADTKTLVTDLVPLTGYVGASFPTGKARSDATGGITFAGPDGLTALLEVRTAAVPGTPAGPWALLVGQPPQAGPTGPADPAGLVTDAELAAAGYQTATQVDARVRTIVGAAPAALDTLQELAGALGNDADFAGTVTTALAARITRAVYDADLAALRAAIAGLTSRADAADTALAAADRRLNQLEQATPPTDTGTTPGTIPALIGATL